MVEANNINCNSKQYNCILNSVHNADVTVY